MRNNLLLLSVFVILFWCFMGWLFENGDNEQRKTEVSEQLDISLRDKTAVMYRTCFISGYYDPQPGAEKQCGKYRTILLGMK